MEIETEPDSAATPIVLVGCGAVGLPLAVAFASTGRRVLGVDIDAGRVDRLSHGRCDLAEVGLEPALEAALSATAIAFAQRIEPSDHPRVFIIAVPTPASAAGGFDSGPLDAAVARVSEAAREGDLICMRSTVPIGTTRALAGSLGGRPLRWAACPDRTLAGRAYAEQFQTPHLVGGLNAAAGDEAATLFAALGAVVRVRDPETAEAIKLFANVARDVTFALANQFALICEAAGIDVSEVRAAGARGYGRFEMARPGPVGGPCLTKDGFVLAASPALERVDLGLLAAARALNAGLAPGLAGVIAARLAAKPGPVAILGMGFKGAPETRDQRFAFGGELVLALKSAQPAPEVRTWDPVAGGCEAARDAALRGAVVVVLANEHPALIDAAGALPRLAPDALVYDLTGLLEPGAPGGGIEVRRFGDARAVR